MYRCVYIIIIVIVIIIITILIIIIIYVYVCVYLQTFDAHIRILTLKDPCPNPLPKAPKP